MTAPVAPSPLDAAARLAGQRGRVVLHGAGGSSFVAAEPSATLIARGRSLVELDASGRPARRFTQDPLDAAEAFLAAHGCTHGPGAPGAPDAPRVIGYLGYDLVRVIEPLPGGSAIDPGAPDLWLAAYGAVARWVDGARDHEVIGPDREACARLAEALAQPAAPQVMQHGPLGPSFSALTADDAAHHIARIERVHDHLAAGDVSEVHLARRLVARLVAPGDPLALLAALVDAAPTPWGALLETDGATIIAAAAAPFVPRADPPLAGYAALWRAGLPDAAVIGAPRLAALQLIDELEPVRRGPYGGALGHVGAGACTLALATRLGVLSRDELRVHAGCRIAAGVDAAAALAETDRDAAPWIAALARLEELRAGSHPRS